MEDNFAKLGTLGLMRFQYSQLSRVVWKDLRPTVSVDRQLVSVLSVESSGLEDNFAKLGTLGLMRFQYSQLSRVVWKLLIEFRIQIY